MFLSLSIEITPKLLSYKINFQNILVGWDKIPHWGIFTPGEQDYQSGGEDTTGNFGPWGRGKLPAVIFIPEGQAGMGQDKQVYR